MKSIFSKRESALEPIAVISSALAIVTLLLSGCSSSPLRFTPGFDQGSIKKVIVYDFKDRTDPTADKFVAGTIHDQEPGKIVANRVAAYLAHSGPYEVIERRLVRDALKKEVRLSNGAVIDIQMLRAIGKSLGADGIITGEVNEAVMRFIFMVEWARVSFIMRLTDVDTGETAWEFAIKRSASNMFPYEMIDESCKELAELLNRPSERGGKD